MKDAKIVAMPMYLQHFAKAKRYYNCEKDNHFQRVCRSKHHVSRPQRYDRRANEVSVQANKRDSESSEKKYMYSINSNNGPRKSLKMNGVSFEHCFCIC